jgi:hypothetical protein
MPFVPSMSRNSVELAKFLGATRAAIIDLRRLKESAIDRARLVAPRTNKDAARDMG